MAQLMPLPLTVSCFSKIQVGFTFLVEAHLGSPGKGPLNRCVCVCGNFYKTAVSIQKNSQIQPYFIAKTAINLVVLLNHILLRDKQT